METGLAVAAIAIASLALAYVVWSGQRQARQLSAQIKALSEQAEPMRKPPVGDVYEQARIRDLEFFLPAKSSRPIAVFEDVQKDGEEITLGKEITISKRWETELHVRFLPEGRQRLQYIRWGFSGGGKDRPVIVEYRTPFMAKAVRQVDREIYQDWHGYWHIEFPFPRFVPKDFCFVLSFTVKGKAGGRFPLEIEIGTEEGMAPFKETLWVEITD